MKQGLSIAKWYTIQEYYNEEGIQISKKDANKHYIIIGKSINVKIEGATGYRTIWYQCEKNKQLGIW